MWHRNWAIINSIGIVLAFCRTVAYAEVGEIKAPSPVTVKTRDLPYFYPSDKKKKQFGALEYIGGIILDSNANGFGGFSSFSLDKNGNFLAITDESLWLRAKIKTDSSGKIVKLENTELGPLLDQKGNSFDLKENADSESITVFQDQGIPTAIVGFERNHRLAKYRLDQNGRPVSPAEILPAPLQKMDGNKGIETLIAPMTGPLAGKLIAISEEALDRNANIRAAIIDGKTISNFSIKRVGGYAITDGATLPNGDLLILERRFSFANGLHMRIRHLKADTIQAGSTINGAVLIEADLATIIDNMEGIAVTTGTNGEVFITLLSDDNFSLLQRTILLRFKLMPNAETSEAAIKPPTPIKKPKN
jgi:hypothetical protein